MKEGQLESCPSLPLTEILPDRVCQSGFYGRLGLRADLDKRIVGQGVDWPVQAMGAGVSSLGEIGPHQHHLLRNGGVLRAPFHGCINIRRIPLAAGDTVVVQVANLWSATVRGGYQAELEVLHHARRMIEQVGQFTAMAASQSHLGPAIGYPAELVDELV